MVRHLHDIAGGAVLTAPSPSPTSRTPRSASWSASTWAPAATSTASTAPCSCHAIRDLTADAYGGWKAVTNIQAGGGLYAQRIVTRRHYDLDAAKRKALAVAGLGEGDTH